MGQKMKSCFIIISIVLAVGCSTPKQGSATYLDEPAVAAEVRATEGGGVFRYLEASTNKSVAVQWIDVEFEIITPAEYSGKIVCLPISLESPPDLKKDQVYSIWLPLSVIEGKSNIFGYYFPALMRKTPNQ